MKLIDAVKHLPNICLLVASLVVFEFGLAYLMFIDFDAISVGMQVLALLMFILWLIKWNPNMTKFTHIPNERIHYMVRAIKSSSFVFGMGLGMFSYGIYSFIPTSLFFQFRKVTILQGIIGLTIGLWQLRNMDK
jgi:hypothetical protein